MADLHSLESGSNKITVDPAKGGRITSFKINEFEFLAGKNIHPEYYGSTFWPSPQSLWNWPPPGILDSSPYSLEIKNNYIKIISKEDPATGFQFIKEFSPASCGINLTYTIKNIADKINKAAPWEISRVPKGGIFFFPFGEKPLATKVFEPVNVNIIDGILWYKDEKKRPENHRLSMADGSEGWTAFISGNKLFIKKFQDIKPEMHAPGEGEVLFYVSAEADYIEIEVQGRYVTLDPEEKTDWKVEWIGAEVPDSIRIEKGNKDLVELVRQIVK
jgi:hypothetical protein